MAAKRPKKAYKMPEKINKGERVTDKGKVSWIIGDSIGIGGFGEIYSATKADSPRDSNYVIKIEPLENGPLFCERTVYINIGKKEHVDEFIQMKRLKYLGLPSFYGFGSHLYKEIDYRFIVIEKLGQDIWKIFLQNNRKFSLATTLKIGVQILNVLEYMHSKGYVHGDVKGANLLLGNTKATENNVHLVDFGLACKFPKDFKPNPKKAHNGTLEYTSRDAHVGVATRRGDIEILLLNLLQWNTSSLPWEKLTAPNAVQEQKEKLMKDSKLILSSCYKNESPPGCIRDFIKCLTSLKPTDEPDYDKLRDYLNTELKSIDKEPTKLNFAADKSKTVKKTPSKTRPARGVVPATPDSDTDDEPPPPKKASNGVPNSKKNTKKVVRSSPKKDSASTPVKRSWKDFPTVVNGAGAKK